MADKYQAIGVSIPSDVAIRAGEGVIVAFLMFHRKTVRIGFHWLPELFIIPMPDVLRKEIVERLRFHADMLENGELEREMQQYAVANQKARGEA